MKKTIKYIRLSLMSGVLLLFAASCTDFLDREPLDEFEDKNYWTSEANVKTFVWDFYQQFKGYGVGDNVGTFNCEYYFLQASASINITDDLANGTYLTFPVNSTTSNDDWKSNYEVIRRANIMLEKLPTVPGMTDAAFKHWEGVARLFRAQSYFRLVQRFGNVPYYDYVVNTGTDKSKIYQPAMNRNDLMNKVLADINYACDNIYEKNGADGTSVNRYVALALKSRIALYEGTYRKYHKAGDGTAFLKEAKDASSKVIASGKYSIGSDPNSFVAKYNSENLSGNKEMILYRQYEPGILSHAVQAYTNTSTVINGMTKACVESYVTSNGLPIGQVGGNVEYKGDRSLANVLTNRDPRLAQTIDPEGISYVGKNTSISRARKASTGYVISLFYNPTSANVTTIGQNSIDAPIFTYAEVLLNYAEACAELGGAEMTQADLDKSVNVLRTRVGLPKLVYVSENDIQVNGVTINDPKRVSALEAKSGVVSSLLWEIRRERRTELITWSHGRYYDIIRWHKGEYIDTNENPDVVLGAYIGTIPEYPDPEKPGQMKPESITLNADGYLVVAGAKERLFTTRCYLNNIPTADIQTYKNNGNMDLPQNPGWD